MPLNIDLQQILLHLLNFVILATGLSLLLFRPVRRFMEQRKKDFEDREAKIAQDREENETLRQQYEEKLKQANQEIRELREKEEARLADDYRASMASANRKASAILLAAEEEAEARKGHILESAQTEIGELVVSATEKLLCETAAPERDSALYDAFLKVTKKHRTEENEDHKA